MPGNPLVKNLKLAASARAAVVGAPPEYIASLALPKGSRITEKLEGAFDWIQLFVKTRAELERSIGQTARALRPNGLLWITFPKASSGIQTDLSRDKGWDPLKAHDLKWITLVSVDASWSAFSLRPNKPGEPRQTFR